MRSYDEKREFEEINKAIIATTKTSDLNVKIKYKITTILKKEEEMFFVI